MDLLITFPALILLAPLMLLIAVLVRLDRGPALFRQDRIGLGGRTFQVLKFRSMKWQAPDDEHRKVAEAWFRGSPAPGGGYKDAPDPRVTRLGRILRSSSLDELPQLVNVLRGEMSLVGPRPGIGYELDLYEPWYFERQAVRPGMTGLWQVSGRDRLSAREMMELDVRYVRHCSLGLDLKILALTVPALIGRRKKARAQ